jgi:hypothetical protein
MKDKLLSSKSQGFELDRTEIIQGGMTADAMVPKKRGRL